MSYRIVFLALLLAGCGQKGALYLPQKAPVPAAVPAVTVPEQQAPVTKNASGSPAAQP